MTNSSGTPKAATRAAFFLPRAAFEAFVAKYPRATLFFRQSYELAEDDLFRMVRANPPAWQRCKFLVKSAYVDALVRPEAYKRPEKEAFAYHQEVWKKGGWTWCPSIARIVERYHPKVRAEILLHIC